jgi:IS30 family transposase
VRHLTSEVRQQELDWRRSQVLQCSSEGYSIREIAQKLRIDKSAVNRDIQFLKQQAQDNLQHHIHEVVPMEYERCITGMKRNLKQTLEIAETAVDPKVKLQARAIANDCYKYIMDLTTNGAIVTDAIKYVTQKVEQVNTLQKLDERMEAIEEEGTIGC